LEVIDRAFEILGRDWTGTDEGEGGCQCDKPKSPVAVATVAEGCAAALMSSGKSEIHRMEDDAVEGDKAIGEGAG
jgi:hypothetical protein